MLSEALERVGEVLASETESGASSVAMMTESPWSESDSLFFLDDRRRDFIVGPAFDVDVDCN